MFSKGLLDSGSTVKVTPSVEYDPADPFPLHPTPEPALRPCPDVYVSWHQEKLTAEVECRIGRRVPGRSRPVRQRVGHVPFARVGDEWAGRLDASVPL